jgi:hypothetical protein
LIWAEWLDTANTRLRFESSGGGDLLLMTTGIEDPRNLGAIVRCGLFLGARAMLVPSRGSAPLSPTVSRTSSGALESMPMVMVSGAVNAWELNWVALLYGNGKLSVRRPSSYWEGRTGDWGSGFGNSAID